MADFFDAAYEAERSRRKVVKSPVSVIRLPEPTPLPHPLEAGSVGCVWAVEGSQQLAAVAGAVEAKDADAVARALTREVDWDDPPPSGTPDFTPEAGLAAAPVLAELRYRGKLLIDGATYMPHTHDHLSIDQLAYSGGALEEAGFDAVSYCLPDARPLSFLLVLNPPHQTETERALVQAVPSELSEVHVAASLEPRSAAVATEVATWVGEHAVTWAVEKTLDKTAEMARDWAKEQAKHNAAERRAYEQQRARQGQAARDALRHGGRAAASSEIPAKAIKELEKLDPTAATQELLEIRRALMALSDVELDAAPSDEGGE